MLVALALVVRQVLADVVPKHCGKQRTGRVPFCIFVVPIVWCYLEDPEQRRVPWPCWGRWTPVPWPACAKRTVDEIPIPRWMANWTTTGLPETEAVDVEIPEIGWDAGTGPRLELVLQDQFHGPDQLQHRRLTLGGQQRAAAEFGVAALYPVVQSLRRLWNTDQIAALFFVTRFSFCIFRTNLGYLEPTIFHESGEPIKSNKDCIRKQICTKCSQSHQFQTWFFKRKNEILANFSQQNWRSETHVYS